MHRRAFVPALAAAGAVALAPAVLAADNPDAAQAQKRQKPARRRGRGGLMADPRFDALSMEGKRLIEYSQQFLNKLPQPGPAEVGGWLLSYDQLSARDREQLRQLLVYVEYMSKAELQRYLGADARGRAAGPALKAGLIALAQESRIPYHAGPKVVITSVGPWSDPSLTPHPPDARLLPHVARDLAPAGVWYAHVTGAATTLAAWTQQVLNGGAMTATGASAVSAALGEAGIQREMIWSVLGDGTNPRTLVDGDHAPYLVTTAVAKEADEYVRSHGIAEKFRMARTAEDKRAVRRELRAMREEAMEDLRVAERYPHEGAQRFLGHVLFGERGVKDRGNSFVHVGALRTMQLVHPKFLYVQFGAPDPFLRAGKQGRTFGEQGSVGQGAYSDQDYFADMDQWSYYHWLEAQRHPHYAGESTFVLFFGPARNGATQAVVSGPGVAAGTRVAQPVPLERLIDDAVSRLV